MSTPVQIMTHHEHPRKALSANSTDASFVPKTVVLFSAPPSDFISAGKGGAAAQNLLKILPYGVGADNSTFKLRVVGWEKTVDPTGVSVLVPHSLIEATCTMCALTGIATGQVGATERFCDTIVSATAYSSLPSNEVVSPADDTAGHIVVDLKGCYGYSIIFDMNSSATSANALVKGY